MRYVSATDVKQGFAEVLDAAQREPVMIRRQKRRRGRGSMSVAEYEKLTTPERPTNSSASATWPGERAVERGLTEEKLAELLAGCLRRRGIVIDTNVLISRLLGASVDFGSRPSVRAGGDRVTLLLSEDTTGELA